MPPPGGGGLPSLDGATFDAVLVGTDLPQALLAAALSLAGRSVLHVDAGDGYGGGWATRPLSDWQAALETTAGAAASTAASTAAGGTAPRAPAEPPLAAPALPALFERFGPGAAVVPTPHLVVGAFPPPRLNAWPPPAPAAVDVPPAVSVNVDGVVTHHANGGSPRAPPLLAPTTSSAAATPLAAASARVAPLLAAGVPAAAVGRIFLDQLPRPLLGAGALVPLLQSTSAGHYVEFVAVDGAYVHFGDAAPAAVAATAASAGHDGGEGVPAPTTAAAAPPATASALTGLHRVPTSRADVFRSPALGPVDKRLLMRFLSACALDGAAGGGSAASLPPAAAAAPPHTPPLEETFEQHMVAAGLGPVSRTFLRHAVAGPSAAASAGGVGGASSGGGRPPLSAAAGVTAVRRTVASMAALAIPTALLLPRYGTGELPQAFARVAAVHGAVYALRTGVAGVIVGEGAVSDSVAGSEQAASAAAIASSPPAVEGTPPGVVGVVLSGGEVVTTSWLFAPPPPPPPPSLDATGPPATASFGTWRWVGVTDGRLLPDAARPIVYLPKGASSGISSDVTVLSVDSGGRAVPEGLHVVSAATAEGGRPADLVVALSSLLDAPLDGLAGGAAGPAGAPPAPAAEGATDGRRATTRPPRVLWGALYWQPSEALPLSSSPPPPPPSAPRWAVVRAATGGVDADEAVAEAARCYGLVGGLPPFFEPPPPPPDPEAAGAALDQAAEADAETTAAASPAGAVAAGAAAGMAAVRNGVHATGVGGGT